MVVCVIRETSRVQRPESSAQSPASRAQRPESRVQSPASRVQRPETSIQLLRPESRNSGMPKQNKTAREIFAANSLEIIWFSFLLLILIENAIKNAVTAIISLYMVCLENPENPNSEIVMCRGQLSAESPG